MIIRWFIAFTFLMYSSISFANSCLVSDLQTYQYEKEIQPRWDLTVTSSQKVYFHSAPKESCKMEDDYIIQNDRVIGYSLYQDHAHEQWIYVMFANKEHDDDESDELVEGWVKLKDFRKLDNYMSATQ